ncbi:unnamed protein product [Rotaria sordida]|uniref:ADP-ribosylhydrolase ARH3 n=1 Tax=Rotaria sordida TaxID=392033 RepID=A0A815G1Y1_9BILA|nr:unnamed protein product [Rotaria sordida]
MVNVLYSLVDVNQRFDQLLLDPLYIRNLDMTSMTMKSYHDRIYSIDNQVLSRICKNILPRIHHQINELIVEQHSMELVLHTIHYPHLYSLSLIDFQEEVLLKYLRGDTILRKLLIEQITCLHIEINDKTTPSPLPEIRSTMFILILSLCKRLIKLNFTPFYHRSTFYALDLSSIDCMSSTLTELEIYVKTFDDCLYLLDERLNCLSTLKIHVEEIVYTPETIDNTVNDGSMALCLANSLVARHSFEPYDQLVRYKWWFRHGYMSSTGNCFDIGDGTRKALCEFEKTQKAFAHEHGLPLEEIDFLSDKKLLDNFPIYCSPDGAAGNRSLMRLAPVPLFFYRKPEVAVEFSGISGRITHGDKKALDGCRYYGALIKWFKNDPLHPEIENIAKGSFKKEKGYDDGMRGKGYIVYFLEAVLWAFWSTQSFEAGALAAVNLGDDTDTTAAIYGQLAGAHYGFHKLPPE